LHRGHEQHIFADGGFDQRVIHISGPTRFIVHQRRCARVAAIKNELLQAKAKRVAHFGVAPVAQTGDLEAARHALAQATGDQQRRRTQNDHAHIAPGGGVFVPQAFDLFGPVADLLNFVQHQHTTACLRRQRTRHLPLRAQPHLALQAGAIGAGAVLGHGLRVLLQPLQGLTHQRGFAHLPRARHNLQKPPRLLETGHQRGQCCAFNGHFLELLS
jgi:hypothetical protein